MGQFVKTIQLPVQLRVLNVLKYWIEHHADDFSESAELMDVLKHHFLEGMVAKRNQSFANNLMQLLERKVEMAFGRLL